MKSSKEVPRICLSLWETCLASSLVYKIRLWELCTKILLHQENCLRLSNWQLLISLLHTDHTLCEFSWVPFTFIEETLVSWKQHSAASRGKRQPLLFKSIENTISICLTISISLSHVCLFMSCSDGIFKDPYV